MTSLKDGYETLERKYLDATFRKHEATREAAQLRKETTAAYQRYIKARAGAPAPEEDKQEAIP